MCGFEIGDKVIADKAIYDYFEDTFRVVGFETNTLGMPLVLVKPLGRRSYNGCVFYPEELSHVSE